MESATIPPIHEQHELDLEPANYQALWSSVSTERSEYEYGMERGYGNRSRVPSATSYSTGTSTEMEIASCVEEPEAVEVLVRCR